ncbi:MAG: iron-containing alcohol dehydrogenase [Tissierellia bacterium]|nr:iron-containing alcohol dehydrogenase [Tissierellia bacterium]
MLNFSYHSPTKILFGKDTELEVGKEVINYGKKILLHYGGGSIKKIGLYDRVIDSLKKEGIEYIELGGVQPNPRLSLVRKGIEICKEEGIDLILAVGGGSVVDSAKAIGIGAKYDGDVWELFEKKAEPNDTIPVGVILTLPATGSETSNSTVITNEETKVKVSVRSQLVRPAFAILNPETTYSLPKEQTVAGISDIMAHIFERYFTHTKDVDLTDRLCEGSLRTLIKYAPMVLEEPNNYAARAEIMWAGTVAHNGILGVGREDDWASHKIGHEISAMYDTTHGVTLSIVFPAWMKYVYKHNIERFAQFAVRVFDVEADFNNIEAVALEGIRRLEEFFKSIGLPTTFKEAGIPTDKIEEMAKRCITNSGSDSVGFFVKLYEKDIVEIYKLALE